MLILSDNKNENSWKASEQFQMLFVGRIHPVKNLELLFETLHHIKEKFNWKLTIVGTGEADYMQKLKDTASVFNQIEWRGEVDGDEKYQLIAQGDLLVLLSHTENFGIVVIEALSQGTAVLVSKNVGISEYVVEQNFGLVLDPTPVACADAINKIYLNEDFRFSIRTRAPQCVARDFSSKTLVAKYIAMYRNNQMQNRSS